MTSSVVIEPSRLLGGRHYPRSGFDYNLKWFFTLILSVNHVIKTPDGFIGADNPIKIAQAPAGSNE
ncbi:MULTISPECIES: hypothetical protein [Bradyrhizobium]|jgi:hypothetical protein|uniref:hypothetical protein n=1 Tax=Bradyrhizobium TaxID=374 RepID=UPI0011AEAB9A|nr:MULTISPECIES: hypothetical protein [Bradyrhizobium]